jgi:NAD(P)-dependent dehydrogenase (short-subunit alcohol dehydrogenase family)
MEQVVLVTGSGSGIGRATALAFAERKAKLVLTGRRSEPLEECAAACRGRGTEAMTYPVDVGKPEQVRALFEAVHKQFERLDVLFNNAGTGTMPAPIEDVPFAQWERAIATNVTGAFLCTQEAIRLMKAQDPKGGRIINNGSISAHTPRPLSAPYTISKHAMTGLTRSTALEGRVHNIACGQIDIGNAQTSMTARMVHGVLQADGSTAPEPVMDVEHAAAAVVHMATLPLDANILFMTIMASGMPYVGRG